MATVNEIYPLALQLERRETNLYPRVNIFISSQEIGQSPVDLNHTSNGAYYNQFIPSTEAYYHLQSNVYTDAGHTVLHTQYGCGFDTIKVDSMETEIGWLSSQGIDVNLDPIEAEIDYISSQIGFVSSNLEAYGGGGGKSYNVYTRGKSPWTHAQRDAIISGTKSIIHKINEFNRDYKEGHKDELLEISSSKDEIIIKIDSLGNYLNNLRSKLNKNAKSSESKKTLKEIDYLIGQLAEYKDEVNKLSLSKEYQELNSEIKNIKIAMVKLLPDEYLEDVYKTKKKSDV